jgi:hypothetical protein
LCHKIACLRLAQGAAIKPPKTREKPQKRPFFAHFQGVQPGAGFGPFCGNPIKQGFLKIPKKMETRPNL